MSMAFPSRAWSSATLERGIQLASALNMSPSQDDDPEAMMEQLKLLQETIPPTDFSQWM